MGYKMVRIDKLGKVITGNTPSKNKKEYYNEQSEYSCTEATLMEKAKYKYDKF